MTQASFDENLQARHIVILQKILKTWDRHDRTSCILTSISYHVEQGFFFKKYSLPPCMYIVYVCLCFFFLPTCHHGDLFALAYQVIVLK
jgi:hypothetical protein